jgi:hypothetical protein
MRLHLLLLAQLGVVATQVDAEIAPPCECGAECTMAEGSGGTGTCGEDGQCAVFFVEPDCGTQTTTAVPVCPDGCTGMALRAPNFFCDDGSLAGPICDEPDCEWIYRTCPSTSSTPTTQPVCPGGCSGEPSDAANFFCDDGSLAGPVCDEPDCAWRYRTCPVDTTPQTGDADCPCGHACAMEADGSGGLCGTNGVCAVFVMAPECPHTTAGAAECPHGCPGPAPMAPNYQCPDGSIGGPVCAAPSCHWAMRTCPDDDTAPGDSSSTATTDATEASSTEGATTAAITTHHHDAVTTSSSTAITAHHHDDVTTSGSDDSGPSSCPHGCPPPAPGAPNYPCPDGSVGGPVCAPPSCQWRIRQCPSTQPDLSSDGASVALPLRMLALLLAASAAAGAVAPAVR